MSFTVPTLRSATHASVVVGAGASSALFIAASRLSRPTPLPTDRRMFSTDVRRKAPVDVASPPKFRPRRMPQRYPHNQMSKGLVLYQQDMPKNLVYRTSKEGRYGQADPPLQSKEWTWGTIVSFIAACFGNSSDPEASSDAMVPQQKDAEHSVPGIMLRNVVEAAARGIFRAVCEMIVGETFEVVWVFIGIDDTESQQIEESSLYLYV